MQNPETDSRISELLKRGSFTGRIVALCENHIAAAVFTGVLPSHDEFVFHRGTFRQGSRATRVATKPNLRPVRVTVPAIIDLSFVQR